MSTPTDLDTSNFDVMVGRLSRLSVTKHFDAYADIDWDAPEMAVRIGTGEDTRSALPSIDPVSDTDWYRGLTPAERSDVAMYRYAACMRTGWQFENILQQGLLAYALRMPNGTAEFRYVNHEVIEEGQHTLMFQEFVDRTGLPVRGMPRHWRWLAATLARPAARRFPALFFLGVLGGEEPVDHLQRQMLREGLGHPLVERIMRIHVTEEARHLSFARQYLRNDVPRLGPLKRFAIAIQAPLTLSTMAAVMMRPPRHLVKTYGIPKAVLRQAYAKDGPAPQAVRDSLRKVRTLLVDLGLVNGVSKVLWKRLGIWDEAA